MSSHRTRPLHLLLLAAPLVLAPLAPAQVAPPAPPPTQAPVPPAAPAPPMSKADKKALLDSVDSMTDFVSADTALPIHHRVKRKLISRDEVTRYLRTKFNDDESTKRLQRSELVLKRFGLLPADFDLGPFLISLLTEQIAGFYDNKTKTVNLLDWVAPEEQKPVLAHELTHALQDQTVDLEKWSDSGNDAEVSRTFATDQRHIATDELETAREAVTEGQAMVVFYDDALRPSHKSLADLPDIGQLLDLAGDDDKGSPVLNKAPLLLRESLLFPYTDGLRFEHALLVRRGKEAAFADVLAHPPDTSWQILHPAEFLAGASVPTLPIPDLHPLLDPAYDPYDVGQMGELDVRILGEVLGGASSAARLSLSWQGGFYYAAQRRSATPDEKRLPGSIALLYRSRWRTSADAHTFLALYALGLRHQLPDLRRNPSAELNPTPTSEEQVSSLPSSPAEGDFVLVRSGRDVLITEGLPLPLARQLRSLFPDMGSTGTDQTASLPLPGSTDLAEPSLHFSSLLHGIGVPVSVSLSAHLHPLPADPRAPSGTSPQPLTMGKDGQ